MRQSEGNTTSCVLSDQVCDNVVGDEPVVFGDSDAPAVPLEAVRQLPLALGLSPLGLIGFRRADIDSDAAVMAYADVVFLFYKSSL